MEPNERLPAVELLRYFPHRLSCSLESEVRCVMMEDKMFLGAWLRMEFGEPQLHRHGKQL
jgi:hypothetical protein